MNMRNSLLSLGAWMSTTVALGPVAIAAGPTSSSTTTIRFPEQGGGLPRAPMPEGAAPSILDGLSVDRPTPEEGVQDDLPRAPIPEGRAPEGPVENTRPGSDTLRPTPEGGVADPLDRAPMPTTRPVRRPPVPPTSPTSPISGPTPTGAGPRTADSSRGPQRRFGDFAEGSDVDSGLRLRWNGYLRLVIEAIDNDDQATFIGRNDGFKIANARIGLRAQKGDFLSYVSFDAAAGERETFNDPNQELALRPRDILLRYRLAEFASITLGRFKVPYDLGQLEATAYRIFVDLPVESRGVLATQGFEVEGLSQGRQLGGMIHRERLGLDPDGFDVGYALALTNGRTLGLALNDNDRVAGFGRLSLYWADVFQLNVAGFLDNRTVGELPDLFDEDVRGLEVSVLIQAFGFSLEGQWLYQSIAFDSEERPDVDAMGGHAQIAYALWAFDIAYRFAQYDPINTDDKVTEHTVGLGYTVPTLPLRFLLNGTMALEDAAVRADNNRLAFLTQFVF